MRTRKEHQEERIRARLLQAAIQMEEGAARVRRIAESAADDDQLADVTAELICAIAYACSTATDRASAAIYSLGQIIATQTTEESQIIRPTPRRRWPDRTPQRSPEGDPL